MSIPFLVHRGRRHTILPSDLFPDQSLLIPLSEPTNSRAGNVGIVGNGISGKVFRSLREPAKLPILPGTEDGSHWRGAFLPPTISGKVRKLIDCYCPKTLRPHCAGDFGECLPKKKPCVTHCYARLYKWRITDLNR